MLDSPCCRPGGQAHLQTLPRPAGSLPLPQTQQKAACSRSQCPLHSHQVSRLQHPQTPICGGLCKLPQQHSAATSPLDTGPSCTVRQRSDCVPRTTPTQVSTHTSPLHCTAQHTPLMPSNVADRCTCGLRLGTTQQQKPDPYAAIRSAIGLGVAPPAAGFSASRGHREDAINMAGRLSNGCLRDMLLHGWCSPMQSDGMQAVLYTCLTLHLIFKASHPEQCLLGLLRAVAHQAGQPLQPWCSCSPPQAAQPTAAHSSQLR